MYPVVHGGRPPQLVQLVAEECHLVLAQEVAEAPLWEAPPRLPVWGVMCADAKRYWYKCERFSR